MDAWQPELEELKQTFTDLAAHCDYLTEKVDKLEARNARLKDRIRVLEEAQPRKAGRKPYGEGYYEQKVLEPIKEWWLAKMTAQEIADELNRLGVKWVRRCRRPWTRQAVWTLVSRHKRMWLIFEGGDKPGVRWDER